MKGIYSGETTISPTSNHFDINKFNAEFEMRHQHDLLVAQENDTYTLNQLNNLQYKSNRRSFNDHMSGIKNTWFNVGKDMSHGHYRGITSKENRLFYIGVTLIIIAVLLYLLDGIFRSDSYDTYEKANIVINNTTPPKDLNVDMHAVTRQEYLQQADQIRELQNIINPINRF